MELQPRGSNASALALKAPDSDACKIAVPVEPAQDHCLASEPLALTQAREER
jgi:hypothetical protein